MSAKLEIILFVMKKNRVENAIVTYFTGALEVNLLDIRGQSHFNSMT